MTAPALAERVLIFAPVRRDAELLCDHLSRARIVCESMDDMAQLCDAIEEGAGALLFTEEALTVEAMRDLIRALERQPPWSQLPVLLLTGLPAIEAKPRSFPELGRLTTLTLVDRPVRIQSLVSTVRSALTARMRQYEVRRLMEELEDRVRERDRFLAILGHELRNPLGAILLASQMTRDDGTLDADHARLIERQSRHLTRIVNDLLDLSRVVSGKIVIKPEVIDLRLIAEQSLETLRESARRQNVQVELRVPPDPLLIKADPVRADQILTNVLSNAIKYTPSGGSVEALLETNGTSAVIRVADDGVGIAPERLSTIFELFAQAENAIGRAQGGMGIGLALVRNLTELQGGTVSVVSDGLGKGSEFVIEFPLATEQLAAPLTQSAPSGDGALKRRIVIVEDNADVRELLRLKLHRLGHAVEAVGDGLAGVNTIMEFRPDMALIDIGLPQLDGYQVASQVRSQLGEDVVLVAVSGFGQPEDKRKSAEAGFDDHITKPADVQDIENILLRFPSRRRNETLQ